MPVKMTPRQEDHGWWNCDDCRNRLHNLNKSFVLDKFYHDKFGQFFTKEYVEDMMVWLADQEQYEEAAVVRDFVQEWSIQEMAGMVVPDTEFY
jgi:hypothetical protein